MSARSLNKVLLIGNLTRDPELRYTPSGAAVCSFGLATNRVYVASDGTKKEEAEFIRIVSWNKLAELCSQLLTKGRKVYVEGRLQTRNWETPDGQSRQITEVVIDDMRILDSRRSFEEGSQHNDIEPEHKDLPETDKGDHISSGLQEEKLDKSEKQPAKKSKIKKSQTNDSIKADSEIKDDQKVDLEDLPF